MFGNTSEGPRTCSSAGSPPVGRVVEPVRPPVHPRVYLYFFITQMIIHRVLRVVIERVSHPRDFDEKNIG